MTGNGTIRVQWTARQIDGRRAAVLRGSVSGVLVLSALLAGPTRAALREDHVGVAENRRCLNCHGQRHIAELSPHERRMMVGSLPGEAWASRPASLPASGRAETEPATRPALFLGPDALAPGMHAELACVACHPDAQDLPHAQHLAPAACATRCHADEAAAFRESVHAEIEAEGEQEAPTCTTCHGGHDIRSANDRLSRTFPLNIINICGDCHERHRSNGRGGPGDSERVASYLASVHGRAVTRGGLVVAATCVDCHGHHAVLPAKDPRSSVYRENVPGTCGKCHLGIDETYAKSIHGQKVAEGDTRAPICTDCHTAHRITRAETPAFMLDIVAECGDCHEKQAAGKPRRSSFYRTYRKSYHGQVTALGSIRAARCSDCHGAHDIQPIANEASRLHGSHRIEVCRTCHKGVDARFVQFEPHADFRDAVRYPLLHAVWLYFVIVMSGAFGFFGLHSILWFIRSLIERAKQGPRPRFVANPHAILRFTVLNRVNHAFVVITFFGLTLTGLPLFFSDHAWAKDLGALLGGGNAAGVLHRIFAVMLVGNFVTHLVGLFRRWLRSPGARMRGWLFGPDTMLPRLKDLTDCLGMFRWFFRGGAKPAFDRWTYWEKFDYMAEIFGTFIIGGSGLLLWFPIFFSSLLPGWMFNVAMIVHGYEALLAVGFIFTIHFFNAHLRLEKFPVDDVIFTGRLPEGEFKHERGVQFARLMETGELEALKVPPAPPWQRKVAIVVGLVAMAIGSTLVVLIILAGISAR